MRRRKSGTALAIFGIPVGVIIYFLFMFFVADPIIEEAVDDVLESLGEDSLCPIEFSLEEYKVCFNAEGDVIVDGAVHEQFSITIDGIGDTCYISAGDYDFEYTGCKLDKFKQLHAHNLILISRTGHITIKGGELLNQISKGSGIVKISPQGTKSLKRLTRFIKFL